MDQRISKQARKTGKSRIHKQTSDGWSEISENSCPHVIAHRTGLELFLLGTAASHKHLTLAPSRRCGIFTNDLQVIVRSNASNSHSPKGGIPYREENNRFPQQISISEHVSKKVLVGGWRLDLWSLLP